tara:strand:+ start:5284 stop:6885 length:1602 start_codon:yes stop_codon:yes gene_type:complete
MPGIKSKAFKKAYSDTIQHVPQGAVWSGRGIGIPVAGAVDGSGDGSKYLGRPRRPPYKDDQGSPSQSADSTYSSYLARVNKDWGEITTGPMFPEQDEGDDDIYKRIEDPDDLTWYGLGKNSPMRKESNLHFNPLDEDTMVYGSNYSLSDIDRISERSSADVAVGAITDIGGDAFRSLLGLAAPPVVKQVFQFGFIALNISQLNTAMSDSDDIINEFYDSPNDTTRDELQKGIDEILTQFIDLIQVLLEAIPDAGVGDGISFLVSLRKGITAFRGTRWAKWHGLGGGNIIMRAILSNTMLRWSLSAVLKFLDSDIIPSKLQPHVDKILKLFGASTKRIILMADLIECYKKQKKQTKLLDTFTFNVDTCTMTIQESRDLDLLKQFIREATRDTESYYTPKPDGYEYRRPPQTEEEEEDFEIQDEYDDTLVKYRADGGVVSYQSRPDSVQEESLRTLIRNVLSEENESIGRPGGHQGGKISRIMADYDYDDDDDDMEEQDSVSGYMQPLGYGSAAERKERRDSTIRAVAGAFGGAS